LGLKNSKYLVSTFLSSNKVPLSKFQRFHQPVVDTLLTELNNCIYQHQKDALVAIKDYFQVDHQPNIAIVVLPTGSGKSGIASLAPYVLNSRRVLVIIPSIVISKKLFNEFW
jgi:superfamily II DNA or RNA helicase